MGEKTLKARLRNPINTENNWKSSNPILLNGEIAYSSDTYKFKVGNGTNKWSDLSYAKAQSADTATKLSVPRAVNSSNGDFDMTFAFDGSKNVDATLRYYHCRVNVGSTNNYKYHRFGKVDKITSAYTDKSSIFLISQHYSGGAFGIVKVDLRTNNSSTTSTASVQWLIRKGFSADSIQVGLYNVFGETYADLFLVTGVGWASATIRNLASGDRYGIKRTWTLLDSAEVDATTTTDRKTSVESYSSIENAATELHGQAYTNIITGVDAGYVENANKVNGHTVGINVPSTAKFTDTTYTSKTAVSGGTDVSLVTTGEKAIWNAKTSNTGTITGIKMNGVSKGSSGVVDLGTVLTSGKQTTTSTADGGSNVYTFSDNSTITVKNGSKGSAGTKGTRGSVINYGTAITGTSATATIFGGSGLTSSLVGDMYMNTSTSYLYRCTVAGNASTAKWVYVGSMKGATGAKGDPGVNATTTAVATTSANGLMSKDMVTKLNGIASGATAVSDSTVSGWGYLKTDAKYKLGILSAGGTAYPIQLNRTDKNDETGANSSISLVPGNNVTMSLSGSALTINARDSTYSTGTASTSGLTKLYTTTGTNTDGTLTQSAINSNYVPKNVSNSYISNTINGASLTYSKSNVAEVSVKSTGVSINDLTSLNGLTYDTGWKTVNCGNGISAWSTGDAPRIRRVGKTVELVGIITNSTSFADHDSLFRNIPEDMRPSRNVWSIQQGDIKNKTTTRWMMTINPGGTVSFNYYGFSGSLTISTGMCIPVHAVWMVD